MSDTIARAPSIYLEGHLDGISITLYAALRVVCSEIHGVVLSVLHFVQGGRSLAVVGSRTHVWCQYGAIRIVMRMEDQHGGFSITPKNRVDVSADLSHNSRLVLMLSRTPISFGLTVCYA